MYVFVSVCGYVHMGISVQEAKEGTEITLELAPCGCWELNVGVPQEWQVYFTTQSSRSPRCVCLCNKQILSSFLYHKV